MLFNVVAVQHDFTIVIAHPGQDVELSCTITPSGSQRAVWIINNVAYIVQHLYNGILTGYNSNGNNLIIENIMMNDIRNNTKYSCGTILSTLSNSTVADIRDESDPTILYVAGEYLYNVYSAVVIVKGSICVITYTPRVQDQLFNGNVLSFYHIDSI